MPALGQPAKPGPGPADSAGRDLPVVVTLDAAECRRLLARQPRPVEHQPAPGVAHQPGREVDSRGRPIPPADLPGNGALGLDGPLELPLTIPLSTLMGDRAPPRVGATETPVARVRLDPMTGRLALNGRALEPPAEDALAAACREHMARAAPPRR